MANTFVRLPERGDIVLGELSTKKVKFAKLSDYDDSAIDKTAYEVIGVVAHRDNNKVLVVYKNNASKAFCNRPWWYISGFSLDGAEHTITLTQNSKTLSVTYNASDIASLVSQLNTAMQGNSDFAALDWSANEVDGDETKVFVSSNASDTAHYTCSASGVTITGSMPEIVAKADIRRKHGGKSGDGSIAFWYRSLAYYRTDQGKEGYQGGRTSTQTSIKQNYPINLPTWLGTSTKNPGDFCAALRAVYGEGEEGWLKFMRTCLPVLPCDYGNMGQHDGLERTKKMAEFTYTSAAKTSPTPNCAAADYCTNISTEAISDWWLPTTTELAQIAADIQYGTNSSRESDVLNKALYKIGGTAISNGSNTWSFSRYGAPGAWGALGGLGYFNGGRMYSSYVCVPVCSIDVA